MGTEHSQVINDVVGKVGPEICRVDRTERMALLEGIVAGLVAYVARGNGHSIEHVQSRYLSELLDGVVNRLPALMDNRHPWHSEILNGNGSKEDRHREI